VDWDAVAELCHKYACGLAGGLFGAGWWLQADALITQKIHQPVESAVSKRQQQGEKAQT
jgi:hypothetical protein